MGCHHLIFSGTVCKHFFFLLIEHIRFARFYERYFCLTVLCSIQQFNSWCICILYYILTNFKLFFSYEETGNTMNTYSQYLIMKSPWKQFVDQTLFHSIVCYQSFYYRLCNFIHKNIIIF